MLRKTQHLSIIFFFYIALCFTQNISVTKFELLSNDLEARVNPVKFDGDACALIKIETITKNLVFEGGSLGIAKVVQKKGEVWVYVPYGARFLTIRHEGLGVLRNYEYPTGKLQKSTTYALQLTTAKIITTIEEKLLQFGSIKSNPEGADVYIDGVRVGTTPTKSLSLLEGSHTVRISKHLYENKEATLIVTADKKFTKSYTLTPKFGTIKVDSKPESGASITLDGKLTAKGIVQRYLSVIGGEERVNSVNSVMTILKATIQGTPIVMTTRLASPNRTSIIITVLGNKIQKTVFDGTSGYVESKGDKINMVPYMEQEIKLSSQPFTDLSYRKGVFDRIESLEGEDYYVIKYAMKEIFYNKRTGLKFKEIRNVKTAEREFKSPTTFGNYKLVNGIFFPYSIITESGPLEIKFEVQEIKINEGVFDEDFK